MFKKRKHLFWFFVWELLETQVNILAVSYSLFAPKFNLLEMILPSSESQVFLVNASKMFSW